MARVFPSSDHAKQQKVFVKGPRASFENILHVNRMKELEQKDSFVNLLYRDTFLCCQISTILTLMIRI